MFSTKDRNRDPKVTRGQRNEFMIHERCEPAAVAVNAVILVIQVFGSMLFVFSRDKAEPSTSC
ncbi:hypothetical protein NQ011_10475 [Corynebacterium phoceense]|uniref:hypothetical protein n=1 Tax=Corynebacterium phoceense TaxID=1686286 RepID=UPI00211B7AD1|nr:hypothetical protein [Corynebacterium phoceense]MCQ9337100.1 hypothetical protein [Corynebacterium phoceense]